MPQIHLDHQLIAAARRIMTGANIHRIKELLFVYEQAVHLHNCGWPTHRIYQKEHEIALRREHGSSAKAFGPTAIIFGYLLKSSLTAGRLAFTT